MASKPMGITVRQRRVALEIIDAYVRKEGSVFWTPIRVVDDVWKASTLSRAEFYVVAHRALDETLLTLERAETIDDAIQGAAQCAVFLSVPNMGPELVHEHAEPDTFGKTRFVRVGKA